MGKIEVRLLGSPQFLYGEGNQLAFKTAKEQTLLAYLLLNRDAPIERRVIAAMLWPEAEHRLALNSLRVALTRLKQTAKTAGLPERLVLADRRHLEFNASLSLRLDVEEFELLVASIRHLPDPRSPHDTALWLRLESALELYRGDLLEDTFSGSEAFEESIQPVRARLRQEATWVAGLACDIAEKRGDYVALERHARWLVAREPWHEEAHRHLMLALDGQQRLPAALAHFESFRTALAMELGVEPGSAIQAVAQRLRSRVSRTTATTAPPLPGPIDHRTAPHHVTHANTLRPGNLPAQLAPIVGRETEIDALTRKLRAQERRLITVTGIGGVGKSRLAFAVADRLSGSYANGVWYADFGTATIGDALDSEPVLMLSTNANQFVIQAIADAINYQLTGTRSERRQLTDALASWHALLVLDNFDLYLNSIGLLSHLLRHAPRLSILCTSRVAIDSRHETCFPLSNLSLPDDDLPVEAWSNAAATAMLVQSVRRHTPAYTPAAHEWPHLTALCRLVDGHALALELAAAALRVYSPAALRQEVESSIDVLATQQRDMPARQRSMRAVISQAWQQLTSDEARVLAALSFFSGAFSLKAACAVADTSVMVIDQLVARSLVTRRDNGSFTLHMLLRRFAREQLAQRGEQQTVAGRHAQFYLNRLQQLGAALFGPEARQTAEILQPELSDIQQAFEYSVRARMVDTLLHAIDPFLRLHLLFGMRDALARLLRIGLARLSNTNRPGPAEIRLRVNFQTALARLHMMHGDLTEAQRLIEEAHHALSSGTDHALLARAHMTHGDIQQRFGRYHAAQQAFASGLASAERAANDRLRAEFLSRQSFFIENSLVHGVEALALARRLSDTWLEARIRNRLAVAEANRGRFERAYDHFCALLEMPVWTTETHVRRGYVIHNLGNILRLLGAYSRALHYFDRAMEMAEDLADEQIALHSMVGRSEALNGLGAYDQALVAAEGAIQLADELDAATDSLFPRHARGYALAALGEWDQAAETFTQVHDLAIDLDLESFAALGRAGQIMVAMATDEWHYAYTLAAPLSVQLIDATSMNYAMLPMFTHSQTARALIAADDARGSRLVEKAYGLLQTMQADIKDPDLRHAFTTHEIFNRQILSLRDDLHRVADPDRLPPHRL